MKKIIGLLLIFFATTNFAVGQKAKVSPKENVTGRINTATISIDYGSPSVKGRKIWGALVPFDKIWRAGANEATTFLTDKDIIVEGKKLPAGKYSLFIIPNEKKCIIILTGAIHRVLSCISKRDTRRINQPNQLIMTREQTAAFLKDNAQELTSRFNAYTLAHGIKLSDFTGENLKKLQVRLAAVHLKEMLEERGIA